MDRGFSALVVIAILVGGSIALFSFTDALLITFAPGQTYAQAAEAEENSEPIVLVVEEKNQDVEEYFYQLAAQANKAVKTVVPTDETCPQANLEEDLSLTPLTREYSIDPGYTPESLVRIQGDWSSYCVKAEVKDALLEMMQDAKKEGLTIQIYSAHRSYSKQAYLYERWQERNPLGALYPAVAEPGHSEHQLGTAVDLKSGTVPFLGGSNPFGQSPEYRWMVEHAHKYGFTQSYPEGKEEITGYIEEPWHWRYLGEEIATEIKEKGTTITQHLLSQSDLSH
jgi:LAS superfamily LD-carboxypeptidase LdcB